MKYSPDFAHALLTTQLELRILMLYVFWGHRGNACVGANSLEAGDATQPHCTHWQSQPGDKDTGIDFFYQEDVSPDVSIKATWWHIN